MMHDVFSHRSEQRFDLGAFLRASMVLVRGFLALVVRLWHRVRVRERAEAVRVAAAKARVCSRRTHSLSASWYVGWHEWPFWTALYYLGQATMSIGFGFPSEEDICNRKQDKDDTIGDGFSFSAARNWVNGKYHYPSVEEGGRGGCAASEISKVRA